MQTQIQDLNDAELRQRWGDQHLAEHLKDVSGEEQHKLQEEFLHGGEWVNKQENNSSLFHAFQTLAPLKRFAQQITEHISYKLPDSQLATKLSKAGLLGYIRESVFGTKAHETEKPSVVHDHKPAGPKR